MHRHLKALHEKPEHVRKRMAVGLSVGITGLVAIIWIATLAGNGAFALAPLGSIGVDNGSIKANNSTDLASSDQQSNFSKLLGAVGASSITGNSSSSEPALTIVDQGSSSSFGSNGSQSLATDTPHTLSF